MHTLQNNGHRPRHRGRDKWVLPKWEHSLRKLKLNRINMFGGGREESVRVDAIQC